MQSLLIEQLVVLIGVIKSCFGSGIYVFPDTFRYYGVKLTIILTLCSAFASMLGAFTYININEKARRGNTLSSLATNVFNTKARYVVDILVIMKSLVVAAGYLGLCKELLKNLNFSFHKTLSQSNIEFCILFLCLMITPSVLASNISKLKNLSYLGILGLSSCIFLSYFANGIDDPTKKITDNEFHLFTKIGGILSGFSCHQNIIAIHNNITFSAQLFKIIVFLGFCSVSLFYLLFGYLNYSKFDSSVEIKSLFDLWEPGMITNSAVLIFTSVLIVSLPNQLHPAKTYFSNMLKLNDSQTKISGILMICLCYSLTCTSWYGFDLASNIITKPMNACLCFLFPTLFMIYTNQTYSTSKILKILYLLVVSLMCLISSIYPKII